MFHPSQLVPVAALLGVMTVVPNHSVLAAQRATQPFSSSPAISSVSRGALLGTYHRTLRAADLRVTHDPSLERFVGGRLQLTIKKGSIHVVMPDSGTVDEYYRISRDGRVSMIRFLPGTQNSFCSEDRTAIPPIGYYRWAMKKHALIITRIKDSQCPDRPSVLVGRWTKTG